jgi:hypothetical protein
MIKTLLLGACLFAPMLVVAQDQKPADQMPAQTAPDKKMDKKAAMVKTFHCDICNKDIKGEKAMRAHMKKEHGMAAYCAKCNKGFKTKEEMMAHMKEMHPKKMMKADKPAEPAPAPAPATK